MPDLNALRRRHPLADRPHAVRREGARHHHDLAAGERAEGRIKVIETRINEFEGDRLDPE